VAEQPQAFERISAASRSRLARLALGVTVLVLAFSAVADGAGSSLKLTGPRSNKLGTRFSYTISGYAAGAGDYVVAWEQLYPRSGCAGTYAAESARAFLPSTYGIGLETATSVRPGSSFSIGAAFHAVNPGQHRLCAYLISLETGATYAHAAAWWTNR
jgi:hypothetical protein